MIQQNGFRTLLIGESIKWIKNNTTLCEGSVIDDFGADVWVLKTKEGDKCKIKKVKIKRILIITKEQEKMDVRKVLMQNKFKKETKDSLLNLMETSNPSQDEKDVIVEVLVSKGVNIDDIPNYDAPVKENKENQPNPNEDTEEDVQVDTLDNTPPPIKEKVMYEEPLTEEELEIQKKQQKTKQVNKTQKKDVLLIDPNLLVIEEGFNTRFDLGDIDELKNSIIENGVRIPIRGYKENEKYIIIDGHRRCIATLKAISEGHDIARIPFISEKKRTEEERIFDIILSNDGKQLTALELGETYRRLMNFGYNYTEIAKKIGKTIKHVSDMVEVANSSKELKDLISRGDVSATLIADIKNRLKDSDLAEKIIKKKSVEKQKKFEKSGKEIDKKVTKRDVRDIIEKQKDNSKNSAKHKNVDDIKENKTDLPKKLYSEDKVKELLQQQIDACKEVLPNLLKTKLDSVKLIEF